MTTTETSNSNPFNSEFDSKLLMDNLNAIDSRDIRTKFKNTQDPITLAFQTFDRTPLKLLARDFIKDSFFDAVSFISKLCK